MDTRKQEIIEMAELYYQNEKALMEYYQECAKLIPEMSHMFDKLAKQELEHMEMFKKVKYSMQESPHLWSKGRFFPQAIKLIIEDVKKNTLKIKEGSINKRYALNFARDVETSMIEAQLGESFETKLPDFKKILYQMQDETEKHRETLNKIINQMG